MDRVRPARLPLLVEHGVYDDVIMKRKFKLGLYINNFLAFTLNHEYPRIMMCIFLVLFILDGIFFSLGRYYNTLLLLWGVVAIVIFNKNGFTKEVHETTMQGKEIENEPL